MRLRKVPRLVLKCGVSFWLSRATWWLLPILGLVIVLLAAYGEVTVRRFERANGITGELLAGKSAGQTFVARYSDLSGVELQLGTYGPEAGPARASLVLHLKEKPGSARDLATARLPAGAPLDLNPWYLFAFPPIHDSQDRTFYIEVESPDGARARALTLYWWQPDPAHGGDPYAFGTAYLDGRPRPGDLAFGLRYAPSPWVAAAQLARAMSPNFPIPLMALLFAAALAGVWVLLYLAGHTSQVTSYRVPLSAPWLSLGVALINGLLYLLIVPPWQGPDEHTHFAYAALIDRYDLDPSLVQSLYLQGTLQDPSMVSSVTASMVRNDFSRLVYGLPFPGAPPDVGATLFVSAHQPPVYYWLGAIALRAARAVGISADPYTDPDTSLRVLRGVSLLLSLVVVALAWLAARIIFLRHPSSLCWLLPITIALLPMHTFDTTVAENDVLAEVAVSAVFVAMAALTRWPWGRSAAALAALAALLAVAAVLFTKATGAAAIPLLAGGFMLWAGIGVTAILARRNRRGLPLSGAKGSATRSRSSSGTPHFLVPGLVLGLPVLLFVGALLLAYEPQERAAGWIATRQSAELLPRQASATAHEGHFLLELGPPDQEASIVRQVLMPAVYHQAMTLTISGWVRKATGAGQPLVPAPRAVLRLFAGGGQPARSDLFVDPSGAWQPISATAHVGEDAQEIAFTLTAVGQREQFDDFSLLVTGRDNAAAGTPSDPLSSPTLLNPSAEMGSVGLRPWLAARLPHGLVMVANILPNPQPFSKLVLWLRYANDQYRSFWGNFGWLSVPLPDWLYTTLAVPLLAALAGLAVRGVRRWGRWSAVDWLGAVALVAILITIAAFDANQTMQLVTKGIVGGLTGRYLFVFMVPIVWLLLVGLRALCVVTVPPRFLAWGVWLWITCLMLFAAYCLLVLIVPYYYG